MLQNPEATKSLAAFPISSSAASLRHRENLLLLSLLSPISPLGSSASLLKTERERSESPPRSPYRLRSRQDKQKRPAELGPSSSKKADGIGTMVHLNRSSEEDSGSHSDEPQEFHIGGEKSVMAVQDPRRRRNVDAIFDRAGQAGVAPNDSVLPSSSSTTFTGTGRSSSDKTVATDAAPAQGQPPDPLTHTIYF